MKEVRKDRVGRYFCSLIVVYAQSLSLSFYWYKNKAPMFSHNSSDEIINQRPRCALYACLRKARNSQFGTCPFVLLVSSNIPAISALIFRLINEILLSPPGRISLGEHVMIHFPDSINLGYYVMFDWFFRIKRRPESLVNIYRLLWEGLWIYWYIRVVLNI